MFPALLPLLKDPRLFKDSSVSDCCIQFLVSSDLEGVSVAVISYARHEVCGTAALPQSFCAPFSTISVRRLGLPSFLTHHITVFPHFQVFLLPHSPPALSFPSPGLPSSPAPFPLSSQPLFSVSPFCICPCLLFLLHQPRVSLPFPVSALLSSQCPAHHPLPPSQPSQDAMICAPRDTVGMT